MGETWAWGLADMVESLDAQGYYGADAPSTPDDTPTTCRRWCEEVLRPAVAS
ncbi:hypothetical protein ACIRL2_00460 [Embleya sp. NPDC127516]|uniref:hypothetical protein n=1 Tax=Embleya sp. NPDC127516 TaxID=3363990 RepID=UPI0037FA49D8